MRLVRQWGSLVRYLWKILDIYDHRLHGYNGAHLEFSQNYIILNLYCAGT